MKKEFRAVVHGRVQLVMYRDFAMRTAQHLGITGRVSNLPDGTVEVIAQGEPAVLAAYVEKLHCGSLLSKVDHIDALWKEPIEIMTDFIILYS